VTSPLFRSFLASGGGGSHPQGVRKDNRKGAGEKASANKPTMVE
jgi:hypothetical protein